MESFSTDVWMHFIVFFRWTIRKGKHGKSRLFAKRVHLVAKIGSRVHLVAVLSTGHIGLVKKIKIHSLDRETNLILLSIEATIFGK